MHLRRASTLLIGLSVALVASAGHAQCTKDTECKGDRVCTGGACEAPSRAPKYDAVASALEPAPKQPQYRRRSKALMVTGIVMTSVGTMSLIAALTFGTLHATCSSQWQDKYSNGPLTAEAVREHSECESYDTGLLYSMAGGLLFTGAGLPMLVHGAKKVPLAPAGASITPWLAPSSSGLRLRVRF